MTKYDKFAKNIEIVVLNTKISDIRELIDNEVNNFVSEIIFDTILTKNTVKDIKTRQKEKPEIFKEQLAVTEAGMLKEYLKDKQFPIRLRDVINNFIGKIDGIGHGGQQREKLVEKLNKIGYVTVKKGIKRGSPIFLIKQETPSEKVEKSSEIKTSDLVAEFQTSNMILHKKLKEKYDVNAEDIESLASDCGFRRDYINGELYWVLRYS